MDIVMTLTKRAFVFILTIAVALTAWSYSIKGSIISDNSPVQGVMVKLNDSDGKETDQSTTDSKGVFVLSNIESEKIVVLAEAEGYSPLRLEIVTGGADTDLGKLNIERIIELKDVTVTTSRSVASPGKTIVYASKVEQERATSPYNMMTILSYKAPQIQVRESERILTIAGEEPVVLVNGIKRSASFIASLRPDAIEKIEFSTVPDIRFGKCYINITTRPVSEGGWVMADVTAAVTTPRNFISGVAEYMRGKNAFMLYYNGDYRHGRREIINEEEHYIGGDKDISLSAEGKPSSSLDKAHQLNFIYTRVPSKKSMLVATATLDFHKNDRKRSDYVRDLTRSYDRTNDRGYKGTTPRLSLYYNLKASENSTIEIDAMGSYTDYDAHRNLSYSTGYDSRMSTTSPSWDFSTEAIWSQKLPFAWLNTGLSFGHSKTSTKYTIDGTPTRQVLRNTNLNVYTAMSGSLWTVGYRLGAGLRWFKAEESIVSPDFTVNLQRNLGSLFSLSYNFRYNPQMPSMSNYNDLATPINDVMFRVGNDNIKAAHNTTNKIQIDFSKNKFFISLQSTLFNASRPIVMDYSYQDDPTKPLAGFFLERQSNGKKFVSYGFDCNIGVSNIWNFLSFRASTGWGHSHLNAAKSFTHCTWYLDLNMSLYWNGWQLNMTAENVVPQWSLGGYGYNLQTRRWPYTSLALYKKIGKFNLHVSWSNLFSRYGGRYCTKTLSEVVAKTSDYRMNDQGNLVEVGVRYQFVTGKLLNKRERSIRASSNSDNGVSWDY